MKFCGRSKGRERAADGNGHTRRLRSHEPTTRQRQSGVGTVCGNTAASGANSGPDLQQRPQTALASSSSSSRKAGKTAEDAPLESDALAPSRNNTHDAGSPPGLASDEDGSSGSGSSSRHVEADGRVACSNCLRRFSPDRVGVHQDICERVNAAVETRGVRERKCQWRKTLKISKPQSSSCRRGSNRPLLGEFGAAARARGTLTKSEDPERRNFVNPHTVSSAEKRTVRNLNYREVWIFKTTPCGVKGVHPLRGRCQQRCSSSSHRNSNVQLRKSVSLNIL